MLFLAIVLPGIYFIMTGNIIRGIISLLLMASLFGWVLASIWAVMFRNAKIKKGELKETKKQMDELTDAVKGNNKNTVKDNKIEEVGSTAIRAAGAAAIIASSSNDAVADKKKKNEDIQDEDEDEDED